MHMLQGLCELIFNFFSKGILDKFHGCGSKRPIGGRRLSSLLSGKKALFLPKQMVTAAKLLCILSRDT